MWFGSAFLGPLIFFNDLQIILAYIIQLCSFEQVYAIWTQIVIHALNSSEFTLVDVSVLDQESYIFYFYLVLD